MTLPESRFARELGLSLGQVKATKRSHMLNDMGFRVGQRSIQRENTLSNVLAPGGGGRERWENTHCIDITAFFCYIRHIHPYL